MIFNLLQNYDLRSTHAEIPSSNQITEVNHLLACSVLSDMGDHLETVSTVLF